MIICHYFFSGAKERSIYSIKMIDHLIFFGSLLLLRTISPFPLSDNINIVDSNEKIEFESKDENVLSVDFGKNNTIQDVEK